ncbi:MAG: thiamine-phosphate pyrophosphorylase [Sulfurimonas sp.]|uniref:thiamine-phosphate pyrophosphorylase n=1 Tax=Sulfurimonas sp. TaxID=2022749 RepID=UPI00261E51EA|nr:thiamine-phosphate pyrophosphorylase [Sulfurimonas sp.]MDD2651926.1 thiamine-phosphate pyrophosphorylase [Sulfurimonas sp.]MDD3451948.1 thiamine-phosphate pyrophosphorylase [Sulfurimonas sp.]
MTNNQLSPELYRVIDANLNRLKEGIRVVEDIMRYKNNDKTLSHKLKNLRHIANVQESLELLKYRDSINDVLRQTIKSEMNRTDLTDIILANFKRAQESARVLEELYKLYSAEYSENFKYIRYELYTLEKEILG